LESPDGGAKPMLAKPFRIGLGDQHSQQDDPQRVNIKGDPIMRKKSKWIGLVLALALVAAACGSDDDSASETTEGASSGESVTITIESWRTDDLAIWNDQIIPAFEADFPNINVEFNPTPPADYNAALATRLEGGIAGDLITCRPFDSSLALFDDGHLAPLNDLDGIDNFSSVAQSAWITDDGATSFCVPMASVIHGFIYNMTAFDELGLTVPETEEEFFAVLDAVAADGTYTPLGLGTADQWEAATVGFQNIGPNYWNGEDGRNALISGDGKLTDDAYVDTFETLSRWSEYLPNGASAVVYTDAQNLFTLGKAAIYPSGSWEIAGFNDNADFEFGAFKPPLPAGQSTCYISDHTDIAVGMNAASANTEAAQTFLSWVTSEGFAGIYANALPGFFSLQDTPVTLTDPVAQEFVSWRDECESTIRNSYQILSRGEPNLEDELWATSAGVINGTLTPAEATQQLQDGLDIWYTPGS
jgi:raffinose/stachyose/melibiose transport system substrate-binding protein